jgi:curved DNA-binding protein CbpA
MATAEQLRAWVDLAKKKNYYEILRLQPTATDAEVKAAFHSFALRFHPDRLVEMGPEVRDAASELFKRGVEAYNILSKKDLRERYNGQLRKGRLRMDIDKKDSKPPPPPVRTLEMIAKTPAAKKHAARADRFLAIGKLEDAKVALISAYQTEPYNAELGERVAMINEMIMLEP